MPNTKLERLRLFKDYESNKTAEDIRVEELEEASDERYLAELDPNEADLPVEALWKAWGLEDRDSTPHRPRNRKSA